jgi:hypothetical protein
VSPPIVTREPAASDALERDALEERSVFRPQHHRSSSQQ